MKKPLYIIVSLCSSLVFADNAWDYGKKCAEEIGVELPDVMNCADGVEIPATNRRDGKCDRPSFGVAGCYPGSRLLQFVDTITRNGVTERIRTTVQCRKPNDNPNSDYEFALIQLNETTNKVCWMFPGYGKSYKKPYTKTDDKDLERRLKAESDREWAGNSTSGCNGCHNNGTYLRTPWIMQVEGSDQGTFLRDGGTGNYRRGGRISFAQNIQKKGFACDIGDKEKTFPKLVKINAAAFDSYLTSQGKTRGQNTASPSTCTQCHYMGAGGTTCSIANSGLGESTAGNSHLRFPDNRWMPPPSDWPPGMNTEAEFLRFYAPAIEAMNYCCNSNNYDSTAKVDGRDQKICQGGTFSQNRTPEDPCGNKGQAPQPRAGSKENH